MTKDELNEILEKHGKWLRGKEGGERANLRGADLYGADLYGADLRGANLYGADLREAYLRETNLRGANLYGADLYGADLREADLYGANLRGANLYGANLRGANLYGANLREAKNIPYIRLVCPECGSFIGFKKVENYIIKLEIPAEAKRSSATTNKCRCEYAKVIDITTLDGQAVDVDEIVNEKWAPNIHYKVGEMVYPDSFDEDRWNECSHGIHFFINRQEAVEW